MPKRINIIADQDRLFPVQAFFNAIGDSSFIDIIKYLIDRIDVEVDGVHCEFPENIEIGEEDFVGVQFTLIDEEITVEEQVFRKFLQLACEYHVNAYPIDELAILHLLSTLKSNNL